MHDNNRPLLVTLIIIGILILIALVGPRMRTYSYRGYGLTASAVPMTVVNRAPDSVYYTFYRYIPSSRPTYTQQQSTYTSYSYPSTTQYYPTSGDVVFPDGCTLTSPVSTTTGLPCS